MRNHQFIEGLAARGSGLDPAQDLGDGGAVDPMRRAGAVDLDCVLARAGDDTDSENHVNAK